MAVEQLREEHFEKNLPFMIGQLNLTGNQFYYEYSNGEVGIAFFPKNQKQHQIIRILSHEEADILREKFNLLPRPIFI